MRRHRLLIGRPEGWTLAPSISALAVAVVVALIAAPEARAQSANACLTFVSKWGVSGSGPGQFNHPLGVNVDASGNIYVADSLNHRIQKFTSAGVFLLQWGSFGAGPGQFNNPVDPLIDGDGNVLVSDFLNHRIQKFTSSGTYLTQWGGLGTGDGQFDTPTGMALDLQGRIWVADGGANQRIQVFSNTGTFLFKWGTKGSGPGQLLGISSVALDTAGNVYVADEDNFRISKFTTNGTFLTQWGSEGHGPGQFGRFMVEVIVDGHGDLYVSDYDPLFPNVQKFTNTGGFLGRWGSLGSADGQLTGAFGLALDQAGNLLVADGKDANLGPPINNRIQRFSTICSSPVPAMRGWGYGALVLALLGVAAMFLPLRRKASAGGPLA